jgi:hypothetical protein
MLRPARVTLIVAAAVVALACTDPERDRLRATTTASYDPDTGKLTRLTYDADKNGVVDTWTYMDGAKVLRSELDTDENGTIDRWEFHDADGDLEKIGFSRAGDGKVDAWAILAGGGGIDHLEVSTKRDDVVDRWEWYEKETLVRSAEDTNADGRPDKWETYSEGTVATVAFDENRDATPDRRLTYERGVLTMIESAPDANGIYRSRVPVGR